MRNPPDNGRAMFVGNALSTNTVNAAWGDPRGRGGGKSPGIGGLKPLPPGGSVAGGFGNPRPPKNPPPKKLSV